MKLVDAEAEMLRLASHFVQRRQPVVNIERRVLEPLRHDRPGALLEFQNEMRVRLPRFVVEIFRETKEQNVAQEIEDRFLERRISALRRDHGALDDGAIFFAHRLSGSDVGAVNREAGNRLAHRAGERLEGEIAKPAVFLRKPVEHVARGR